MAKPFVPTQEILSFIRYEASLGVSQEEIAEKLGRNRDTIFINSRKKYPEVYSAWAEGKAEDKKDVLEDIRKLSKNAENENVKFAALKWRAGVNHGISETNKQQFTGADGAPLIKFILANEHSENNDHSH